MTITITQMPGCCTAMVMSGFGGSSTQHHERMSKEALMKEMYQFCLSHKEHELSRQGVVVATLTTEQEIAIALLEELGWYRVPIAYPKPKHPETDLLVFTVGCQELLKWAKDYQKELNDARKAREEERRRNAPPLQQQVQTAPIMTGEGGFTEDFVEEDF